MLSTNHCLWKQALNVGLNHTKENLVRIHTDLPKVFESALPIKTNWNVRICGSKAGFTFCDDRKAMPLATSLANLIKVLDSDLLKPGMLE